MTKHLFSSGEVMYGKNRKNLAEGTLTGEFLEYGEVEPGTEYICIGKLGMVDAQVSFELEENDFNDVKMRSALKILMQSDLFNAAWKRYTIKYNG
jgi:hypothetical protein